MGKDNEISLKSLLGHFLENNKNIRPKDDLRDLLKITMRQGVVTIDPPDGFFVDQGCLGISRKALITGGLGPCVAMVIRQAGRPNFLAHMDSYGFREHTIEEIAATIKERFDPASGDFEMEVHNWRALDELKPTVMKKVSELAIALGHKPEDVILGIPFVTGMHTVQLDETGRVSSGFKGQKLEPFIPR